MSAIVLNEVDPKKRRFLIAASSVVGAGATVAVGVPFVASMMPSARALAAGAPVPVDLNKIEPGQLLTVEFRGAPHWVIKRTPEMVAQLTKHDGLLADAGNRRQGGVTLPSASRQGQCWRQSQRFSTR